MALENKTQKAVAAKGTILELSSPDFVAALPQMDLPGASRISIRSCPKKTSWVARDSPVS